MDALLPIFAIIVTGVAGWAMIKRYQTHMVLLFAGLGNLFSCYLFGRCQFLT